MDRATSFILSYPTDLRTWGKIIWTDPLNPVPRLLGQQEIIPNTGSLLKTSCIPFIFLNPSSTALTPFANLSKTLFTSPPYSIEMILIWSPSFIQRRNFLSLLTKIPLPWGQSWWYPLAACIASLPLNKKWSSISS